MWSRLLFVALSCFFLLVVAEVKAGEAVYIEADHVEIDEKKKVSTYRGSVSFRRGERKLTAEEITVYGSLKAPSKVIASGLPARFVQPEDALHKAASAEAKVMEYFIREERMVMVGAAQFLQEKSLFSGERIIYDLKQDLVIAKGAPSGSERVKIVIYPDEQAKPAAEAK